MKRESRSRTNSQWIVTLDLFFVLFAVMAVNCLLSAYEESQAKSAGTVAVTMNWDPERDEDPDVWCKAEGRDWVGYNKPGSGDYYRLVYDDRGLDGHKIKKNEENVYARELFPGKHTFNVNRYPKPDFAGNPNEPLEVRLTVQVLETGSDRYITYVDRVVTLNHYWHEVTVAEFVITKDGKVDPNSINLDPPLAPRPQERPNGLLESLFGI